MQECNDIKLECILVDDCSPDKSMSIVRKYLEKYKGTISFIITKHITNKGLSCARNTGLSKATGDYIFFMDSDDYLLPESLKYMYYELQKYPSIDIVIGNHFDEKHNTNHFPSLNKILYMHNNKEIITKALEDRLGFYATNKLIRRSMLKENNISFVEGHLYEDILWSVKVYCHTNSLLVLPNNTYVYTYNQKSIMHTLSSKADKTILSLTFTINHIRSIIPNYLLGKYCVLSLRFMTMATDLAIHNQCKEETLQNLYNIRKRLHLLSLERFNIPLSLYYFTLYWPFYYIQNNSFFRHNYYRISRLLYKITI